jgi:septum formation topological specificity factor MinE
VGQKLLKQTHPVLRFLEPLKLSYEAAKQRAEPYTNIVEQLPEMRREIVELVRKTVAENGRAYVWVNDRSEGNAPSTIRVLTNQLKDAPS